MRKVLVRSKWEEEDSPSDVTRGDLGLIAVDVGFTDTGGSGKGHEGGGEIGGNDLLDIIRGGGVYNNKKVKDDCTLDGTKGPTLTDMPRPLL